MVYLVGYVSETAEVMGSNLTLSSPSVDLLLFLFYFPHYFSFLWFDLLLNFVCLLLSLSTSVHLFHNEPLVFSPLLHPSWTYTPLSGGCVRMVHRTPFADELADVWPGLVGYTCGWGYEGHWFKSHCCLQSTFFLHYFSYFFIQVRAKCGLCLSQRLKSVEVFVMLILTISKFKQSLCEIIDRFRIREMNECDS